MSLHNNSYYQDAQLIAALKEHRLPHNKPSQLADAFRIGWMAAKQHSQNSTTDDATPIDKK